MNERREVTIGWQGLVEAAKRLIEAQGGIVLEVLPGLQLGSVTYVVSGDAVTPWESPLNPERREEP